MLMRALVINQRLRHLPQTGPRRPRPKVDPELIPPHIYRITKARYSGHWECHVRSLDTGNRRLSSNSSVMLWQTFTANDMG
jgi:hypothetical protein